MDTYDIIVASHLRWNFVWQRPQQLLSRMASRRRIFFLEEPVLISDESDPPCPILQEVMPGVVTVTPQLRPADCGDVPLWMWPCPDEITRQVRETMQAMHVTHCALWLYTPMPEFLVSAVRPGLLVYDVMDELANFKFAPPDLRKREQRLLSQAAVVFTGGASLHDAKKEFNPNTYLFASGVDTRHYERACHPDTTLPEWMESLPEPRAAYIGVIDERLDYETVAVMARAHPHIQFLMCGPIVKVDPAGLPQSPNLHYPGQQSYNDLPRILKGCQVCLMPFARNEATRFISPTKTLEYMATHRPIVSTPIRDVQRFYRDIVYLAETPEEFAAQIGAALNEPPSERARKRMREEKILTEQAWDAIVAGMEQLIDTEWTKRHPVSRTSPARLSLPRLTPSASRPSQQGRITTLGGE